MFKSLSISDIINKTKEYMLVLEYADSGTLNNYLKEHSNELDWSHKLELASQLTSAVAYIHEKAIIHRDLVMFDNLIYIFPLII